ncbi:unnamed protein product [Ambrosiozyma monospora]|uniref:Unnamed protein product n=1 Tax=Ambrosiozyma monospora TaxID=43982 RepID=A0A9W6T749_AMBMO|nr:unnamed protein product [Ambrosiozyma monospora]
MMPLYSDQQQQAQDQSDAASTSSSTSTSTLTGNGLLPSSSSQVTAPHLASSCSSDSVIKSQTLGTGPPPMTTAPPTTPKLNVSLFNKLLDQPNLLDEINLTKNQKLISYLSLTEVVGKMIEYILYSLTINPLDYNNPDTRDTLMVHDVFEGGNNIEEEGSNNNNNNGADAQFNRLERAFQRASVCSEIMMLSNNALVNPFYHK